MIPHLVPSSSGCSPRGPLIGWKGNMRTIKVDKLQEGMILARDVVRQDGVVLISKGRQITPEVVSLLKRLQVDSVVVEGDEFASEEERIAFMREQERALEERFSRVASDPILKAIRELLRRQLKSGNWPIRPGR